jgi:hypothetical protein
MAKSSSTRQLGRTLHCAFVALIVAACGSDERPPPSPSDSDYTVPNTEDTTGDARDVFAKGSCTDGETKTCRIYLPAHNDVQPCFVGEQACAEGAWGDCGKAQLVDANAEDTSIDPDTLEP